MGEWRLHDGLSLDPSLDHLVQCFTRFLADLVSFKLNVLAIDDIEKRWQCFRA